MELRLAFLAFATLLDPPHNLFFARLLLLSRPVCVIKN